MDELDGLNRLVFSGPFSCSLQSGREVMANKLVIASKNGEVAKLPVSRLRTIKDTLLTMLLEMAKGTKTAIGLERSLKEGGAAVLGKGFYWLKSETEVHAVPFSKKEEKPKSIQELRAIARKITFD